MALSHYKNLDCWKQALKVIKLVYITTAHFPKTELFGLVDQMKRASTSVTTNIAEGMGRGTIQDNIRFLYIAKGSCMELESHILVAQELGFIDAVHSQEILSEIEAELKLLSGFINYKRKGLDN